MPAVDAQSCAAELHHALAKNDYHQACSLIRLAPHPGVFEMVNKQQQNALHLAGKQHCQQDFIRKQKAIANMMSSAFSVKRGLKICFFLLL